MLSYRGGGLEVVTESRGVRTTTFSTTRTQAKKNHPTQLRMNGLGNGKCSGRVPDIRLAWQTLLPPLAIPWFGKTLSDPEYRAGFPARYQNSLALRTELPHAWWRHCSQQKKVEHLSFSSGNPTEWAIFPFPLSTRSGFR